MRYILSVIKGNIGFMLLGVLCFFPILPNAAQSITIFLFVMAALIEHRHALTNHGLKRNSRPLLLNFSWLLLMWVTIFYSAQLGLGVDYIIRSISLIIIPIVLLNILPNVTKKIRFALYTCFIIAHLFLICFIYFKIVEGIDTIGYIDAAGNRIKGFAEEGYWSQFRRVVSMPFSLSRFYLDENRITSIFIHKAYLSMGFLWCIILMVYWLIREKMPGWLQAILVLFSILFGLVVAYFTSVPNIAYLLFLLPLFIFFLLRKKKKRLLFVALVLLLSGLFSQTAFVKQRVFKDDRMVNAIEESSRLLSSILTQEKTDGSNIRGEVWKCAFYAINEQFFTGYGLGSEKMVLKNCYEEAQCEQCFEYAFNAHNQYATLLINGGVLVLLFFLISVVYFIWLSIRTKNLLYLFFLILFLINLVGESMLVRIHGILFFAIFNSLFFSGAIRKLESLQIITDDNP